MLWKLVQHARGLLREESGAILKPFGGKLSVALAYPNTYHVGMSNLGLHKVYALLNLHPNVLCERVFLPPPDLLPLYRSSRTPLFSLESQTPVNRFDVVAFSISFENDLLNVVEMLALAGIPPRRAERDAALPLVLVGGVCPSFNPEPVALVADVAIVGEGEGLLDDVVAVFASAAGGRGAREELLERLAGVPGVYVPEAYGPTYHETGQVSGVTARRSFPLPVRRRWLADMDGSPTTTQILTPHTEFGEMFLVEIARGCGGSCRFCLVGHLCRPARFYGAETVVREAVRGLERRSAIGLVGPTVSDHPEIEAICAAILERGGRVSPSSMRIETLTPSLLEMLHRGGERSITLAPEAGSERLRRVLRKELPDEQVAEAALMVFSAGIPNLRLYFQVGLPTETPEDVAAIASLVKRIRHRVHSSPTCRRTKGKISLSVSPFVPNPWTPFQWEPMEEVRSLRHKLKQIRLGLRKVPGVRMTHELPKWSYVQALLARGDRRVGEVLLRVHAHGGEWAEGLRQVNLNGDFYVHRRRDEGEVFPYDHLDVGITKDRLLRMRGGL
jgi:radical SAM superfamily enzyme YgiQ (UPF0313 family)